MIKSKYKSKEDLDRRLELECEITLELIKEELQENSYLGQDLCKINIDNKNDYVIEYVIDSLELENLYSYIEIKNNIKYLIINTKDDYYYAKYYHKKQQKEEYEKKIRKEKMILSAIFFGSLIILLFILNSFI